MGERDRISLNGMLKKWLIQEVVEERFRMSWWSPFNLNNQSRNNNLAMPTPPSHRLRLLLLA